jgi:hypothetical protein
MSVKKWQRRNENGVMAAKPWRLGQRLKEKHIQLKAAKYCENINGENLGITVALGNARKRK